ncbi:magnesium-dependent phosphatase-1 [Yamadazyma tenuis]|uniref:Magnesium-dependent phosphatase-1 n=1 Tax=Candida tenuis (strain ATCC 10573 / BCRC 21748 / CBS 615 / JCM 9827 / NBRC 10315 / NRRL Y-1498 / VKM Y-70) TaxID=590646 RepID=G3B9Q0_CANTC|nr:magnesium-dependent phosphatase-1 [Yamadazyma tenuis ATCC 10573]EGV61941.1 magnesium-dependent phosphatase-1 [Yamadazyma tenuis ATCC 10573]WEJ93185.1 magnesium-dependent phosphatase-1 [Yamadazyma tenuis]
MSRNYPKAVVFDLDYTLWPCWCDVHIELPLKNHRPDEIIDSYGYKLALYPDVPSIIKELSENGVKIISASRTPTVHIAKQLINHINIDGTPMYKFFDSSQWGTGSKTKHIMEAARELGMEQELRNGEFILFDDEYRNKDVNSIGCNFVYIRDTDLGLTRDIFEKGLKKYYN